MFPLPEYRDFDPGLISSGLCIGRVLRRAERYRLDLFSLLQAQLKLFLGQGLGPAAKAMPLQLLDDLAQPLAFRPLGEQHRLEPVGVVGEGFDGGRHEAD